MEGKINKKRVLFIVTQSEFGGAQRFLYELTKKLAQEKYQILVAAGPGHYTQKYELLETLARENIEIKKLKHLRRAMSPLKEILAFFEIKKLIKSWKPEVVFLSSSKAGIIGSVAAKISIGKKPKVIYRIGGWAFNDPWPEWLKKLWILTEKITARFKDVIILNNKFDYDQAVRLKIRPKKELKIIHNGIDALKIDFLPPEEARTKLKLSHSEKIVGAIAYFYPTKGLEFLIEAARILKNRQLPTANCKFLIIGDGEEREKLESLVKEYGLEKEIILPGQIPDSYKYIKAFDVFVLPSLKEGFPWVILEAMSAKVPIVATSVGAVLEIIENGKNGILIEPGNPRELAEAIKYLLENERTRQEFALQAHQTVLFKFPIEKMIRETEELFD